MRLEDGQSGRVVLGAVDAQDRMTTEPGLCLSCPVFFPRFLWAVKDAIFVLMVIDMVLFLLEFKFLVCFAGFLAGRLFY